MNPFKKVTNDICEAIRQERKETEDFVDEVYLFLNHLPDLSDDNDTDDMKNSLKQKCIQFLNSRD